jgi:hypothetical protein
VFNLVLRSSMKSREAFKNSSSTVSIKRAGVLDDLLANAPVSRVNRHVVFITCLGLKVMAMA